MAQLIPWVNIFLEALPIIKKIYWKKRNLENSRTSWKYFGKKNRQKGVISKRKSRDFGLLMTLFSINFWFTNDPFLYNCLSFKGPTMFAFSSKFLIFSNSTAIRPSLSVGRLTGWELLTRLVISQVYKNTSECLVRPDNHANISPVCVFTTPGGWRYGVHFGLRDIDFSVP